MAEIGESLAGLQERQRAMLKALNRTGGCPYTFGHYMVPEIVQQVAKQYSKIKEEVEELNIQAINLLMLLPLSPLNPTVDQVQHQTIIRVAQRISITTKEAKTRNHKLCPQKMTHETAVSMDLVRDLVPEDNVLTMSSLSLKSLYR